jgi:mannosyltransferase OCH1-like enzyme
VHRARGQYSHNGEPPVWTANDAVGHRLCHHLARTGRQTPPATRGPQQTIRHMATVSCSLDCQVAEHTKPRKWRMRVATQLPYAV